MRTSKHTLPAIRAGGLLQWWQMWPVRTGLGQSSARGRFAVGFSRGFLSYIDDNGRECPNQYRPRIGIKQIDSKRALKGFTARNSPDKTDQIPEGSPTGEPKRGYIFRGHFLDLR